MMPRRLTDPLIRESPTVRVDDPVETRAPAHGRQLACPRSPSSTPTTGSSASSASASSSARCSPATSARSRPPPTSPESLDAAIDKRGACRTEPVDAYVNREHIDVGTDHSDAEIAEIFLHHRVLLVPVLDGRRVTGVITRSDFFRSVAERFLGALIGVASPNAVIARPVKGTAQVPQVLTRR